MCFAKCSSIALTKNIFILLCMDKGTKGLLNMCSTCMCLCYTGIAPGGAAPCDFRGVHVGGLPFVAAIPGMVLGAPLLREVGAV